MSTKNKQSEELRIYSFIIVYFSRSFIALNTYIFHLYFCIKKLISKQLTEIKEKYGRDRKTVVIDAEDDCVVYADYRDGEHFIIVEDIFDKTSIIFVFPVPADPYKKANELFLRMLSRIFFLSSDISL